ncbi:MAG: hypothetical protein ACKVOP_06660, partial [Sphingomonadaceae bacterium]
KFEVSPDLVTNLYGLTERWYQRLGFHLASTEWRLYDGPPQNRFGGRMWLIQDHWISFPHWLLLLALSAYPLLRGWCWMRAQRRRAGNLCPVCGYDLRATPERCPECGRVRIESVSTIAMTKGQ